MELWLAISQWFGVTLNTNKFDSVISEELKQLNAVCSSRRGNSSDSLQPSCVEVFSVHWLHGGGGRTREPAAWLLALTSIIRQWVSAVRGSPLLRHRELWIRASSRQWAVSPGLGLTRISGRGRRLAGGLAGQTGASKVWLRYSLPAEYNRKAI